MGDWEAFITSEVLVMSTVFGLILAILGHYLKEWIDKLLGHVFWRRRIASSKSKLLRAVAWGHELAALREGNPQYIHRRNLKYLSVSDRRRTALLASILFLAFGEFVGVAWMSATSDGSMVIIVGAASCILMSFGCILIYINAGISLSEMELAVLAVLPDQEIFAEDMERVKYARSLYQNEKDNPEIIE